MHTPSATARFLQFAYKFGRRREIDGFDVRALLPDRRERQVIFGKVTGAVALLSEHDERRLAYLRRDLPRMWIIGLPAAIAQCHYELRMCVLDFDYVSADATTPAHLALTLVHEGAHARLARAGFRYPESARGRIERVCVRQEAAFARRLPGAERLVSEAEDRLKNPDELFSNRARRERELAALSELGQFGRLGYRLAAIFRRSAV